MTAALAIYAAVVATAGLGWNVASWWLDRRTRLDATVEYIPEIDSITVHIVNRSAHPIRITSVTLLWSSADGSAGRVLTADRVANGDPTMLRTTNGKHPGWIAARDTEHIPLGGASLVAVLPRAHSNLRAVIGTADGVVLEVFAQRRLANGDLVPHK